MFLLFMLFHVEMGLLAYAGGHGGVLEALPNDVDGQRGGVGHLLVKVTVVAQFVEDNLVGREIENIAG